MTKVDESLEYHLAADAIWEIARAAKKRDLTELCERLKAFATELHADAGIHHKEDP